LAPSCFDESNQAECGDLGAKLVVRIQVKVFEWNHAKLVENPLFVFSQSDKAYLSSACSPAP
jgi:hypothetical protein